MANIFHWILFIFTRICDRHHDRYHVFHFSPHFAAPGPVQILIHCSPAPYDMRSLQSMKQMKNNKQLAPVDGIHSFTHKRYVRHNDGIKVLNAIYLRAKTNCEWLLLRLVLVECSTIFPLYTCIMHNSAIQIPEELLFAHCSDADVMKTIANKSGKLRQYVFHWRVDHSFSDDTIRWMAFIRWEKKKRK